jgi:hypothetical protein
MSLVLRAASTALCAMLSSAQVLAQQAPTVKLSAEVGALVKVLSVDADAPTAGIRMLTVTYEALKPCRQLSLFGHSYSIEGIQLPLFRLGATKSNVVPGQKFRDQAFVTYEVGHYVVLERAYCF